ncbi:MAG: hypothetical protein J0L56_07865 [Chitinophagales bacterium]|nr:hypothetical protein [Chitinophagales bacterium]
MRKLYGTVCLLLCTILFYGQQFGGTPPSQKWKQISTDTARVIFPAGMDSAAKRVAAVVHYLAAQQPVSLGDQLRKINIVLQNQTTVGNGYVGLGPYRSEFYLTPILSNFDEGSISWTDQLAVHEYRHVQQFNNFRNGLSKTMGTLFGEEGLALAVNASVPDWFYEGDAVYNETVLTRQGRGRLPLFLNAYPSLWQSGKKYSWMKLRNGSLKDYVPNHYYLGYLLVNYGREKYGLDFWTKVTRDASAFKGLLYPFQKAIERHAAVDYKTFREQAFEFYQKNIARVAATRDQYVFPVNKQYITSYLFPYTIGEDSLLYLKTTYRHRPAFFIRDKTGEKQIRVKDISIDEQYSYRNGKVVYAAYEPDARWGWRDYSVIRLLDIQTGTQRNVTHKTKYFTPDISASGEKIATVLVDADGKSEIHIIAAQDGKVLHVIKSADIMLFTDPKFIDEANLITAVRLKDGKMALAHAEISSGNIIRLTTPSYHVLGYPCVSEGVVYFTASYAGNDDVFALQLSDKKVFKISNGPLGNYYVNVAGGKISWSSFTAEGYQLQQMPLAAISKTEITEPLPTEADSKFTIAGTEQVSDILLSKVGEREFSTEKYKKGTRLLNFHSWRPYYEDPIFTFSLYGENVLNTLQTELYYLYNQDEKTNAVGFSTVFGGLFPYLSLGTEYTFNRERTVGNRLRQWDQLDSRIGLNVPLNFTTGRSFKQLNIGTNYFYRNEFNKGFFKDSIGNTGFSYLHHFISWNQQVQRATQHIYPRLGYGIALNHRHAITDLESRQFSGNATVYLPGIMANHNLVLTGSFQQVDTLNTVFSNRFAYARGYTGRYFSRMWRLSANYHFPVWHTDFGFANILYLQRIRANAFYDFTKVYSRDKTQTRDQRSVGGEIFVDTKWWNQYPLTFGFRVSRLLDRDQFDGFKGTVFELVLPVSILPR